MRLNKIESKIKQVGGESVLYIGFRSNTGFDWKRFFENLGYKYFDVIEIFEENVRWINENCRDEFRNVFCGDITTFDKLLKYDVILWYDGPEHIEENQVIVVLKKLEKNCKMIILHCPNGFHKTEEIFDNKHEKHLWGPTREFFVKLGYRVKKGDNWLLSWKIMI